MHLRWEPSPIWEGEDAYIVGGGPSLDSFDWDLIRGKNVIGCNSAFVLGADVVSICIFADWNWWKEIGELCLPTYGGMVVGVCPNLDEVLDLPKWVLLMNREERKVGLSYENLGFNGNTGSLALNLALLLGARRIFLLGFDMKMRGNRANWHDVRHEAANPESYPMFKRNFLRIAKDVVTMFPGREVVNVSDVSELTAFPKVSIEDHFYASLKGAKT